ncbi:hypothetical protein K8Z61_06470 [Nocardioides sp. TRM66260-LWL]|uniref:hypothetical protein n=1 Tax=Nocardioides sp. TRM66260-LWL TaxID=2874478 RepID=UPI001CC472BE|nr:hypothetical protein [Nocardioides sp. TRM66260-LWL]MBZ5734136.1 hypothetical protein [Nocardioides sp. TRM66260-LWL]
MNEQRSVPPQTGVEALDEVLASVAALSDRPLEDHASVFGLAHETLRAALDGPAD